ncbi:hypothetical protein LUW77_27615 [Streptomyces radiopugnans]|nr:hypothetical protein LUW77_27615 [Streptomyces radiopugnans]
MTLSADTARTPETLVADLRERGVQLWEDGGRLRFRAPRGVLTDEWREALAAHKEAVLACLRAESLTVVRDPEHRYDPFPLTDVQSAYLLGLGARPSPTEGWAARSTRRWSTPSSIPHGWSRPGTGSSA